MKRPGTGAPSPAIAWLQMLWDHRFDATPHSWRTLNNGMRQATHLAIQMGLRFDRDDFLYLDTHFNCDYWAGKDNEKNMGEQFYITAVEAHHIGACRSFEHARGRTPFFMYGKRLRLHSEVPWEGQRTFVTSFDDEKGRVILCAYATIGRWRMAGIEHDGPSGKPLHRYAVTPKEIRKQFPAKRRGLVNHDDGADAAAQAGREDKA